MALRIKLSDGTFRAIDTSERADIRAALGITGGDPVVPDAPVIGVATGADGAVSVTFAAPSSDGGSAITGYEVLLSTGQTATGAASPISVTAPNGTPVTATVRAQNAIGYSPYSAASNSATPAAIGSTPNGQILLNGLPLLLNGLPLVLG